MYLKIEKYIKLLSWYRANYLCHIGYWAHL